jgi:hypothetical protein
MGEEENVSGKGRTAQSMTVYMQEGLAIAIHRQQKTLNDFFLYGRSPSYLPALSYFAATQRIAPSLYLSVTVRYTLYIILPIYSACSCSYSRRGSSQAIGVKCKQSASYTILG